MKDTTKRIVGYAGIALAAALIAGAAVWAIMSARVSDAERASESSSARIQALESSVASLTDSLASAEASLAAIADTTVDTTDTTPATEPKTPTTEKVFCFPRGGRWEGATPYITVDYAQLLEGDEAAAAATAHGAESPPPNDYFIVNDNTKLRDLPVDPNIKVKVITKPDGMEMQGYQMTFGQWFDVLTGMSADDFVKDMPYWITIKNGVVVGISEQFLP